MDKIYSITDDIDEIGNTLNFSSKEKRDKIFSLLDKDYYYTYEIELNDDLDENNIVYNYYVDMDYGGYNSIIKETSIFTPIEKMKNYTWHFMLRSGRLYSMIIPCSEKEYKKGFEYYKHKYISMFNQAQNRINKMMENGMSIEEVERIINKN